MNQPLHDFSEPVLIRAFEENAQEFCNSSNFDEYRFKQHVRPWALHKLLLIVAATPLSLC